MGEAATGWSVVVLSPGGVREELYELLGAERSGRLARLMTDRALECARTVFGDGVVALVDDAGGVGLGDRVVAIASALGEGDRTLIAVPVLATWRPEVLRGAAGDLDAGCAASVGAIFDGGFYLLALSGPVPAAIDLDARDWDDRNVPGRLLLAAGEDGLEVGMLRAERGLRTVADVRALLADPLTDEDVRTVLEG